MSNLPGDLLVEVLVRLPADTLASFRRVSKSWRDLIESSEFIRLHSRFSGRHAPRLLFHTWPDSFYTTAGDLNSPDAMKATRNQIKGPLNVSSSINGYCNGLICLEADSVLLWNPCTKQHKELPPDKHPCRNETNSSWSNFYGFGHDVGHDDYKVVKIATFHDGRSHKSSKHEIEIYSLKSDSWRDLLMPPYSYSSHRMHDGVFANGSLHWFLSEIDADFDDNLVIMALDLTTERFHLVPQPKGVDSGHVFNFTALDGCLCLMVYGDRYKQAQIWTMKQYGVRDSWTKTISFRLPKTSNRGWDPMCCKPIAYSGKILLFLNFFDLMWYNTENRKMYKLNVFDKPSTLDGYAFTGSLVKLS